MSVLAVTGGAHGIGRGIALRFARAGYHVSIADPDEAAGEATARDVRALGVQAAFVRADVSRADEAQGWIAATIDALGSVDVLVNNAGIAKNGPFLELAPEDFDAVIGVNLRGTMLCSQAAARWMVAHGGGAIVNVASTRAFMSEPGTEAYSASKGGIVALTHAMAMSLAPHVRVNCVCPGWIETRVAPVTSERDHAQHPVGRVGTPEDVAGACLYLAGAGFVTGQRLIVDGGMTVKMIYEE
ncbi:MAG TPA: glucose 1-dehydrogenase [Candidatus Limnocylindria bacterium]|nr:glucose 1-dehydrogenase [Candidatus Limnocylindria bacterium]